MKKILILSGGYSKEKEISRASAKSIYKTLKNKYKILVCEPDSNFVKKIKKFKPDVVYNSLHGRFGEDGYIQVLLENLKVKYTHSGVNSSSGSSFHSLLSFKYLILSFIALTAFKGKSFLV